MRFKDVFNTPKIIAVVGDVNSGKTNLLYYLLDGLKAYGKFNLYTYGLRTKINGATEIFSDEEAEQIINSVIILDEVMSLWDMESRKSKKQIEKTLRLINHHNNIIVICALPENLKKFICGKVNEWFYKKCTLSDFINNSVAAQRCKNYKGIELGNSVLSMEKSEALYFDGKHYYKINIPYIKKYDSKKSNIQIVQKIIYNKKEVKDGK